MCVFSFGYTKAEQRSLRQAPEVQSQGICRIVQTVKVSCYTSRRQPLYVERSTAAQLAEVDDFYRTVRSIGVRTRAQMILLSAGPHSCLIRLPHESTSISEKTVVAAYREFVDDGFLITAFMTSSPETILRKGILWQKLPLSWKDFIAMNLLGSGG